MEGKKWINILSLIAFLLIMAPVILKAGPGKIAGRVIDASSEEGLAGPNIEVLGTGTGATTDVDGAFVVLNVTPGTYTVRVSMVGYKTSDVTEVRVYSDRITKLDVKLEEAILEGEIVIVVAEREAVEFDRTNTASYVSQEELEVMPVKNISDVVQLQAGVVTDAGGGLHFRGGRTREVAYLIDGIPVTNTFSQGGGSNVRLENNFIKELQVITGTFNAEYGQAQSGIISVVTKVPEDKFFFSADVLSGGYYAGNSPQYIGLDSYDPMSEKEARFSVSAPIPFPKKLGKLGFYLNGRLVSSDGYLNGERRYNITDGWEIEVYREWYDATYNPKDPLVIPIPDSLHTGDGKIVPMNRSDTYNINTKLVYQPIVTLTAAYNLFYSNVDGKSYSNSWRFCPEGTDQYQTQNVTHMLTLTHTPKQNMFYNLRYSHQQNDWESYMFKDANDPRYQTTAVNAWDPGRVTGYDYGGIESWNRRWFEQSVDLANGDITWQMNKVFEVKAGFEAKRYRLHYKNAPMREKLGYEIIQYPFSRSQIRGFEIPWEYFRDATRDFEYGNLKVRETNPDSLEDHQFYVDYNRYPWEGSGYTQAKLSMGSIILNAGARLDAFYPNDRYAPDYTIVSPFSVGADTFYTDAKTKYKISPRFGLSFPVSTKGAIRLSYGHFFQMPSFEKMYQNPVLPQFNEFSIVGSKIGNPNLKPEETVQYEIGLQQELIPGLGLELTVYYKDIRNLLGIEILTLSNATTFYRYVNKEYGNSSGVTLAFNYRTADGKFQTGLDYTYMRAKGTASSPEAIRDISVTAGPGRGAYTMATRKIDYLNWDQKHSLNASMSVSPAPTWHISLIGQLGSGLPYTPSSLNPSLDIPGGWWDNAGRKPVRWNIDLKASKGFKIRDADMTVFLDIYNVFNQLNENYVNSITGHAGPNAYLPELGRLRYRRIDTIGAFTHDEADYNPSHYSTPRLIQFGLRVSI